MLNSLKERVKLGVDIPIIGDVMATNKTLREVLPDLPELIKMHHLFFVDLNKLSGKTEQSMQQIAFFVATNPNQFEMLEQCIKWLTNKDMIIKKNQLYINNHLITIEHWLKMRSLLCLYLGVDEEQLEPVEPKYANKQAEETAKRAKAARELIMKYKQKQEDKKPKLTQSDYVLKLSIALKTPVSQILEYNLFQFSIIFKETLEHEDFHIKMNALINGADSKKIKVAHWATEK